MPDCGAFCLRGTSFLIPKRESGGETVLALSTVITVKSASV